VPFPKRVLICRYCRRYLNIQILVYNLDQKINKWLIARRNKPIMIFFFNWDEFIKSSPIEHKKLKMGCLLGLTQKLYFCSRN
jgi:hypothetical protein